MPFRSYKQMAFLKHTHPELYKKWVHKYGKQIEPTKESRLKALRSK